MFQSTDFLIYVGATVSVVLALVLHFEPRCGQTNILVYLGICSLVGSLTVIIFSLSYQLFAILHGQDAMKLLHAILYCGRCISLCNFVILFRL